jgi:malonyl-CoA O-methyltransferase
MREVESARDDSATAEVVPTSDGYDRWSLVYDAEDNPLVLLEEAHIGPLLGDVASLAVADIGCGTGRHTVRLAAAGARVTAVDFSAAMLERARAKPGAESVRFVEHDLARPLPLETATFDRVLCCLVLDHVSDLEQCWRELRRLCRPNGFVVASIMHPAMMLRGVQARFIDPDSGRRVYPLSYRHQIADYVMTALRAGLVLDHLGEHAVDAALAARSPRGGKYLGWPLLLMLRLRPGVRGV